MKKIIIVLLLATSMLLGLTQDQAYIKKLVKSESRKYTNYYSLMQWICYTESTYGYYSIGDGGKSKGIMQIQVATAKWLATKDPSLRYILRLSDKRVASLLLSYDEFSIMVACKLMNYHLKKSNYDVEEALRRYNGYYEIDKYGKVVRDINGKRMKNTSYPKRVLANKGK